MPVRRESQPLSRGVLIISSLDKLAPRVRSTCNGQQLFALERRYRTDLYDKVDDVWLQSKTTAGFTYIMAAEHVDALYNIAFDKRDHTKIKSSICNEI